MDAPERAIGFGGTRGLAAGQTYDTTVDDTLPEVYEILIQNVGGTIDEIILKSGINMVVARLASLPSAGSVAVNTPIIAPDGDPIVKIVSNGANCMLYTFKDPEII
jgi:hypothetical protein